MQMGCSARSYGDAFLSKCFTCLGFKTNVTDIGEKREEEKKLAHL